MKKIFFLILFILIFTGCSDLDEEIIQDNQQNIIVNEIMQQEEELDYLEDSLIDIVLNLRSLWKVFDQARQHDIDPADNLKSSEYLLELKNFLGKRESLTLSAGKLGDLLNQSDYSAIDKTMRVGDKEFHIRVIGYNVNFNEQVVTDIPSVKNKWIFVQCWNEEAFYFKTISDGDINYFIDFIPLEINNRLYILMTGFACPYGPYPSFVWAWHLETEGLSPSHLFDSNAYENETYILDSNVTFNTVDRQSKWMIHTNGSYLFAEKGEKDADNHISLMNIKCEIDEDNKVISFISHSFQETESVIRFVLVKDRFIISQEKK